LSLWQQKCCRVDGRRRPGGVKLEGQLLPDPGPLTVDGEIVYGGDGKPIPDPEVKREAEKALRMVRQYRAEVPGPGGTAT